MSPLHLLRRLTLVIRHFEFVLWRSTSTHTGTHEESLKARQNWIATLSTLKTNFFPFPTIMYSLVRLLFDNFFILFSLSLSIIFASCFYIFFRLSSHIYFSFFFSLILSLQCNILFFTADTVICGYFSHSSSMDTEEPIHNCSQREFKKLCGRLCRDWIVHFLESHSLSRICRLWAHLNQAVTSICQSIISYRNVTILSRRRLLKPGMFKGNDTQR